VRYGIGTLTTLALVLTLALGSTACSRRAPESAGAAAHADKKPYIGLQGVIASLPSKTEPRIVVCHAAIPEIKIGPKGEDEPSNPMPFWLGAKANIDGLKEGDAIQFDIETDWDTETPVLITAIKKLGAGNKVGLSCP
jgi:Cu/Ag efflux protein CusF